MSFSLLVDSFKYTKALPNSVALSDMLLTFSEKGRERGRWGSVSRWIEVVIC